MPQNFIDCDRDQQMLMPPDMKEWLPEDHLVWFVIDSVTELDLAAFYADYRADGWGRAAYDPRMMVTLLLYAYAVGVRSAREIERRCDHDVAFRVITANRRVDHATLCRFRTRHRAALSELFASVVGLCSEADMVRPGIVAIDGTKLAANASAAKNLTREQLEEYAREVFDEAEAIDAHEDELYGDKRGDEIPGHLLDRKTRIEWIRQKLADKQREAEGGKGTPRVNLTDPDSALQRTPQGFVQGYNGQLAVTQDQVIVAADLTADNHDAAQLEPMITEAKDNLRGTGPIATVVADAGYFSEDALVPREGIGELLVAPVATRRLADALANRMPAVAIDHAERRSYEAELAVAKLRAARREAVIDACAHKQVTVTEAAEALGVSVSRIYHLKWIRNKTGRLEGQRIPRPPQGSRARMLDRFAQPGALARYATRARTIEPVFGQLKEARGVRRFLHRGLEACRCEWRMVAAAHNLRKLWVRKLTGPMASAA